MQEVITLFIFALIFAVLAFLTRNAGKQNRHLKYAIATIERISHVDAEINYYVSFLENGKILHGKTISYPPSTKRLHVGERVEISYYNTKAGWPRAIIQDNELIPCENSLKVLPKVLLGISVGFVVAVILCVMSFR